MWIFGPIELGQRQRRDDRFFQLEIRKLDIDVDFLNELTFELRLESWSGSALLSGFTILPNH